MSADPREDLALRLLFGAIGTTNRVAVDIGARDGGPSSTTYQFRQQGWRCVLFDARPRAKHVGLAWLTQENIELTLRVSGVPPEFDLLSIDVDGMDYHLWKALRGFRPRVVVIEYNAMFGPEQSVVVPYDPAFQWDKTDYYGASAAALVALGRTLGYALIDVTPGQNLIFLRHDAAPEAVLAQFGEAPLPQAQSCGYPRDRRRRWEAA